MEKLTDLTFAALKSLKRNVWIAISSIATTTAMLLLVGLFVATITNTNKISSDIENGLRINVYLDTENKDGYEKITNEENVEVDNPNYHKIYNALLANKAVEEVTFSDKNEQLEELTKNISKTWAIFDNDSNPLHDVYIVQLNDSSEIRDIVREFKAHEGVAKVEYGEEIAKQLSKLSRVVKVWGVGLIVLLVASAIFLISNTIRIAITARRDEIKVMRLVGATNNYIRLPFLIEGGIIGFIGAIIPFGIVSLLYKVAYESYNPTLSMDGFSMITLGQFMPRLLFVMLSIGMIVGIMGSLMSMQKHLKV